MQATISISERLGRRVLAHWDVFTATLAVYVKVPSHVRDGIATAIAAGKLHGVHRHPDGDSREWRWQVNA